MIRKILKFTGALSIVFAASGLGVLYFTGNQMLSVQSGSMEPQISKGDVVVVTKVSNSDLAVGDIVTFTKRRDPVMITHRIVELPNESNNHKFITQGDANRKADAPLDANQIIGRVERHIPFVGYGLDFAKTPVGLLVAIYVPALIIVGDEVRRLSQYYKKIQVWRHVSYKPNRKPMNKKTVGAMFGSTTLVLSLVLAVPTFALLYSKATLTGNTISTISEPGDDCDDNSTDIDFDISGGGGGGSTTIDIDIDTDQDASSGDATNSGNTNGGDATSGDATNCNSTDIDIIITN